MSFRCVRWLGPLAMVLLAACAKLPTRPDLPAEHAVQVAQDSRLDTIIGPVEALHPDAAGFRLINDGPEAFVIRARSAALAARSLDVQTYIWHADLTGRFLANAVLEAADRGVKVRLLLDDMDARAKNYGFAALDAHPSVRSSAVIGLPDDDLGQRIHAIVDTAGAPIDEDEMRAHLAERLVRYKVPRSF